MVFATQKLDELLNPAPRTVLSLAMNSQDLSSRLSCIELTTPGVFSDGYFAALVQRTPGAQCVQLLESISSQIVR